MDKIFIPTVNRIDNQITYNALPDELKRQVVFVVQSWEREKYDFNVDYLVLPEYITLEHPRAISETRNIIYNEAKDMKYALLDDDITFHRRNTKYWSDISSMKKSKRKCTPDDILEMFEMYSSWLEDDVTVCGCSHIEHPPRIKAYSTNVSLGSQYWINGKDFAHVLPDLKLTEVKVGEDIVFLLSLLTRGFSNRVSQEFCFVNKSVNNKTMKSVIWDEQTVEDTQRDHETIAKMFPGLFEIVYKDITVGNVKREDGGFRDFGKWRCHWNKAYSKRGNNLENFLND